MNFLCILAVVGQLIVQGPPKFPLASTGVDLNTGLISYWKLDESSGDMVDAVSVNDLTNDGVTFTTGKLNNAASFNPATPSFGYIADNAELSTGDENFSISFWCYPATTATRGLVSKDEFPGNGWEVGYISGSGFGFYCWGADAADEYLLTATTFGVVTINTWYHVVAVHSNTSGQMHLYINGTLSDSLSAPNGPDDSGSYFRIGLGWIWSTKWSGRIDELAWYKIALSADQVTALYGSGTPPALP